MRNPNVIASMKGGHFLTVICSVPSTALKAFCGIVLNHSGSPSTAGIGRGRIGSSSGGHRKVIVMGLMSFIVITWAGPAPDLPRVRRTQVRVELRLRSILPRKASRSERVFVTHDTER